MLEPPQTNSKVLVHWISDVDMSEDGVRGEKLSGSFAVAKLTTFFWLRMSLTLVAGLQNRRFDQAFVRFHEHGVTLVL